MDPRAQFYKPGSTDSESAQQIAEFKRTSTNVAELAQAAMAVAGGPMGLLKTLWKEYKRCKQEAQRVRILLSIMHMIEVDTALNGKHQSKAAMDTEDIRVQALELMKDLRSTETQIQECDDLIASEDEQSP